MASMRRCGVVRSVEVLTASRRSCDERTWLASWAISSWHRRSAGLLKSVALRVSIGSFSVRVVARSDDRMGTPRHSAKTVHYPRERLAAPPCERKGHVPYPPHPGRFPGRPAAHRRRQRRGGVGGTIGGTEGCCRSGAPLAPEGGRRAHGPA